MSFGLSLASMAGFFALQPLLQEQYVAAASILSGAGRPSAGQDHLGGLFGYPWTSLWLPAGLCVVMACLVPPWVHGRVLRSIRLPALDQDLPASSFTYRSAPERKIVLGRAAISRLEAAYHGRLGVTLLLLWPALLLASVRALPGSVGAASEGGLWFPNPYLTLPVLVASVLVLFTAAPSMRRMLGPLAPAVRSGMVVFAAAPHVTPPPLQGRAASAPLAAATSRPVPWRPPALGVLAAALALGATTAALLFRERPGATPAPSRVESPPPDPCDPGREVRDERCVSAAMGGLLTCLGTWSAPALRAAEREVESLGANRDGNLDDALRERIAFRLAALPAEEYLKAVRSCADAAARAGVPMAPGSRVSQADGAVEAARTLPGILAYGWGDPDKKGTYVTVLADEGNFVLVGGRLAGPVGLRLQVPCPPSFHESVALAAPRDGGGMTVKTPVGYAVHMECGMNTIVALPPARPPGDAPPGVVPMSVQR